MRYKSVTYVSDVYSLFFTLMLTICKRNFAYNFYKLNFKKSNVTLKVIKVLIYFYIFKDIYSF